MTSVKLKLSKLLVDDGMYYRAASEIKVKRILFYFPFYEFMHYGDHLFFEPIINFINKSGYDVSICPIDGMIFYFEDVGYKVIKQDAVNFEQYDLVISRVEFFSLLKEVKNLVMFKIVYPNIKRPLSQDMLDKLAKLLNISSFDITSYTQLNTSKYSTELVEELKHYQNKQNILFNPYTDSGSYSVTTNDLDKLMNFALKYAEQHDCNIFLTGSSQDMANDKNSYPQNFIDIRGLTTISDLFVLTESSLVSAYIGFDGFLMHLASMYNKPSYVYVRRSTMLQRGNDVYKMLLPYISENKIVTMINNVSAKK